MKSSSGLLIDGDRLLQEFAQAFVDQLVIETTNINTTIDYLFSYRPDAISLAEQYNAKFMPFDVAGDIRRSCQTKDHSAVIRICLIGAESSGKTTLARQLAAHFSTVWVPEYARELAQVKGDVFADDVIDVIKAQIAMETVMTNYATGFLFCDTAPLLTTIWSEWLFRGCPPDAIELASAQKYDGYLLLDTDIAWQDDPVRCLPTQRAQFLQVLEQRLQQWQRPYYRITGQDKQPIKQALAYIANHCRATSKLGD